MAGVIQCPRSVSPSVAVLAALFAQARPAAPSTLPARPHITATRTPQPPTIDGRLDDPVWATAPPSDSFVQHYPDEGAPPTERTTVRVLYDDKNVYIGIDAEQVNAPIVKRLARRDSQIPSDGVWLDIDSRRTGVGAFHFGVNAAGMLSDGIHFDDTNYSSDWDAVWEAKVSDTDRGYTVEFRIPLAVLRFSALPVQDWGFQVRRFIDARQETDDWAFYPRSAATYVPLFGRIDNLHDLQPRHPIELRPFILGRLEYRTADAEHRADAWLVGGRVGRPGRQGPRHQRADAGPGAEPRLRPGRGGHGRPQPVDVRDALPREAPVLPRRDRRLLDGAAPGLHAPHRQAAGDAEPDATETGWSRRPGRCRSTVRRSWSARSARARPRPDLGDHRPQRRRDRHRRRPRRSGGWNRGRRSTSCASSASWRRTPRWACWRRRPTASRRRCR